ncbi:MAG: Spy/CpxP family protein refolding chaperone [Gemmatimonadaceae bacterium]
MMRKTMISLVLALALPLVAEAQRPGARENEDRGQASEREMQRRMPGGGGARILEQAAALGPTEDQATRLRAIQVAHDEKTAPLRARMQAQRSANADSTRRDLSREELGQRRAEMREVMAVAREQGQAARTEAMALLSGDQREKVEKLEAERRKEMDGRRKRGGRRGGPPAGA